MSTQVSVLALQLGRSAAIRGYTTGSLAAVLSPARLCPAPGGTLGRGPGRHLAGRIKLFGVTIGGKSAAGDEDDEGAVGAVDTAQAPATAKVFLDFTVADEIMVRRVIFDVGDLGLCGDDAPTPDDEGSATLACPPTANAEAPTTPPIDSAAATTLMQLCTGQFVAGGEKRSLRGRPLAEAVRVGIRGFVDFGGVGATALTTGTRSANPAGGSAGEVAVPGGVEVGGGATGCYATPTQGSIYLADRGPDGIEFVICTADAAMATCHTWDTDAQLPHAIAGKVVYGMGSLKQIEAMTLTGNLEHISIANCGEWTPETTEARPGEQSEGQSGAGLGITGYTMYE